MIVKIMYLYAEGVVLMEQTSAEGLVKLWVETPSTGPG